MTENVQHHVDSNTNSLHLQALPPPDKVAAITTVCFKKYHVYFYDNFIRYQLI